PVLRINQLRVAQAPELASLKWIAGDTAPEPSGGQTEDRMSGGDVLAFLQYTSGSTGTPNGVMLTHANLLHNAALVYHGLGHAPDDKYISWLPTFHDMGFMAGILYPLYPKMPPVVSAPQRVSP